MKVFVTKEFRNIFMPIYIIERIFLLQRFRVKNCEIVANTHMYYITTFILIVSINIFLVYLIYCNFIKYFSDFIQAVYTFTYSLYIFYFISMILLNVISGDANMRLVSQMQEIAKLLHSKSDSKYTKLVIWGSCILNVLVYAFLATLRISFENNYPHLRVVYSIMVYIVDVDIIYAISVLYFLATKMRRWNEEVKNKGSLDVNNELSKQTMFVLYQGIMDAIKIYQKVFQFTILSHFVVSFIDCLTYIKVSILWLQYQKVTYHDFINATMISVFVWIGKNLFLEIFLCRMCNYLYKKIKESQVIVASTLKQNSSDKLAKNILREYKITFNKISACGVFTIDAALPLRFISVFATYVVVLLQFAFEK